MYPSRRSTVVGKYMLFLLGLINLGLGLYLVISKDSLAIFISKVSVDTNMQLFNNLLLFSGVLLVINGLYNLMVSLSQHKLIFYAALVELIKGAVIVYLEIFKHFTSFLLVRSAISLLIILISIIAIISALRSRFSKKYIFFNK
ncbi:hypothetical protein IMX26_11900 [Clostridium sp. 'deep sea']|uniref:hypothetical protein n=1 Tax=Clostridium sp. 'deep sea' TaxID=2779445 RepID=UPI0018968060|nr:hypothetical protein [Clostridium sp. 'deep sea']QOR34191.1 hypothetical protein IMX26_11900 [Clostridium sp. 'deep sea']